MWELLQANWHKIIVVILAIVQMWKFFSKYIKDLVIKDKEPESMSITLPKEGCIITIKPLDKKDL